VPPLQKGDFCFVAGAVLCVSSAPGTRAKHLRGAASVSEQASGGECVPSEAESENACAAACAAVVANVCGRRPGWTCELSERTRVRSAERGTWSDGLSEFSHMPSDNCRVHLHAGRGFVVRCAIRKTRASRV
jgi:hypothetical protein